MKSIMFVCTGNICRSAMAHAMFEKMVQEQKKDIKVFSCGTYADEGDKPTIEGINAMLAYDVDLRAHRATNIINSKIREMDVILCATREHKNHILCMYPELKGKVFTMKEYAGYSSDDMDIKDPWGYNSEVYEKCAKEISECLNRIINM